MKSQLSNKHGTTLVELLIVMLLISIVSSGIAMYLISQTETTLLTQQNVDMQANSREPLKFMKDEIAVAGAIPEATDPPPEGVILSLSESSIVFQGDIDSDEDTDKVEYSYDSDAQVINRTQWQWDPLAIDWAQVGETEEIAQNIVNFSFEYFDENDGETSDEASVRKVVIMLETGESGDYTQMTGGKSGTRPLTTSIFLRNATL